MSTKSTKVLPVLLGLSVFYYCFYLIEANGTNQLIFELITTKKLHDSDVPLRAGYTGIAPLDEILTYLVVFLGPITDGNNPALTFHTTSLIGGVNAAWTLILLEGHRKGNARTIVAFPIVFGLLSPFLTFAFSASMYFTLQLFTSVSTHNPTKQSLLVPRAVLNTLPISILAGFVIPAAVLASPASDNFTLIFLAIWQFWPVYASTIILLVHMLFSSPTGDSTNTVTPDNWKYMRSLRVAYAVTFLTTAIPHLISWTFPLLALVVPSLFENGCLQPLHPVNIYPTLNPWNHVPVTSIAEGLHGFLTWNYLITSVIVLVWAGNLHYSASGRLAYGKVAVLAFLLGPIAAAVEVLWEREEAVMAGSLASSSSSTPKSSFRRRGGSGMGKWERGGKVLRFDD